MRTSPSGLALLRYPRRSSMPSGHTATTRGCAIWLAGAPPRSAGAPRKTLAGAAPGDGGQKRGFAPEADSRRCQGMGGCVGACTGRASGRHLGASGRRLQAARREWCGCSMSFRISGGDHFLRGCRRGPSGAPGEPEAALIRGVIEPARSGFGLVRVRSKPLQSARCQGPCGQDLAPCSAGRPWDAAKTTPG